MLTSEAIWAAWAQTGQDAHFRIPLMPHGGNVRQHLEVIRGLVPTVEELTQALRAWWASPAITADKRCLGMFVAHLPGVLHHLSSGATHPFGTTPPPAVGVRGSKTRDNAASIAAAIANFSGRAS